MSRQSLTTASRAASRAFRTSQTATASYSPRCSIITATRPTIVLLPRSAPCRPAPFFSTSSPRSKGIMPETGNPSKTNPPTEVKYTPVELSESEYHEIADEYMERLLNVCEEAQEEREDLDIEYSAGVMNITLPSRGTYVLNKQPPNKQIWLSSPISGPKRYDWCVSGESQLDKEDTASGSWIYSRDGSSLDALLLEELGVDLGPPSLEG
ncbi:frataxin-like domain-containing protein [Sarocladium implicatum]|nr:frataxin-like domain-containing protein [Sarocladium implicatum]